ncbi:apolipoprotein N-acyltransferase, partial [Paracoccaceae bacterium]|nr:apolipoprotein N-acyltransferase [Paracoccaceae bacterium]
DPAFARLFFERSLEFTAAKPSVDLVVWPESALPVSFENAETLIEQIALAADGTALLLGALRLENEKVLNSIVYMDQNGVAKVVYDKHHLVPFGEYLPFERWLDRIGLGFTSDLFGTGFAAGEGPKRINIAPLGAVVPLICYEAVFPQDVSFASQEAAILLLLTNDAWFGGFAGPQQHLAQAKMRSIEQGLPMIRVANTGISAMIDPYGRSLKQLGLNTAGFIDAQVPQPAPATLYRRFEIWTVFALLFAILMLSLICRRQISG